MTVAVIGANTGNTYTGVSDAWIAEGNPNTALGASVAAELYISAASAGQRNNSVIKFTGLSNITGPVTVSSAVISIKNRDAAASTIPVSAFRLLVPFVDTQATWNKRDTVNNWTSPGARNATDADLTVLGTGTIPTTTETFFTISGAGLNTYVQNVINGTADFGLLLSHNLDGLYDGVASRRLGSNESATDGNRAYLTVTYTAGGGGPTVTTVTSSGTTEAGSIVFTASLSGATSGTTNYAFALSGTATAGTDYTSPLTSAMCSNGVTVVGSDFVVPTAVSSWTVTIPTTADTTDETNETIILTIGGTASTGGTITDDDPVPAWSVSNAATVTAGSPAIFTISADRASALTQNLTLGFIDGTRVGGTGYDNTITNPDLSNGVTITAGVLTIPAGVTSFTVSVGTV